jgi:NAD(P)-dependent dehydrogenase (short-subunit alcohol dehydrogenase family)
MDVSLNGALHTMHHELSQIKQKNGVIVNIASIFWWNGTTSSILRCKKKVWTYLTSACNERNRINAICPGFTPNVVKGGISFAEVKEHVIKQH